MALEGRDIPLVPHGLLCLTLDHPATAAAAAAPLPLALRSVLRPAAILRPDQDPAIPRTIIQPQSNLFF